MASKPPDLTIVLLGKTGVGKSASANIIFGGGEFESRLSLKPVTKVITEKVGQVLQKQIQVVDTPGILEAEQDIKVKCEEVLQSKRPVLFLVVINIGRFTKEDQDSVEAAERVLGPEGLKNTYLLFTNGELLKDKTLDDFLFEEGYDGVLPDIVRKMSGAYHLFCNDGGDQEQVKDLLLKSGHLRKNVGQSEAAPLEERRIVLFGLPGAGKSASGNTILGSNKFKSGSDFGPVTTECVAESAEVEGYRVTVADTPGFSDKDLSPEQLFKEIMKIPVVSAPGPHVFVFVVRIGRHNEADFTILEMLTEIFTIAASKYAMVLFTYEDELQGKSIENVIRHQRSVLNLVSMCSQRFCVFDNKNINNRKQVQTFLDKVDEIVSANGGKHFTSEMFKMAETLIKEKRNMSEAENENNSLVTSTERTQSDPGNGDSLLDYIYMKLLQFFRFLCDKIRTLFEKNKSTVTQSYNRVATSTLEMNPLRI